MWKSNFNPSFQKNKMLEQNKNNGGSNEPPHKLILDNGDEQQQRRKQDRQWMMIFCTLQTGSPGSRIMNIYEIISPQ